MFLLFIRVCATLLFRNNTSIDTLVTRMYIYSVCVCVYIKTYSLCNVCTEMVFVFEYIPIHETLDTSGRGYYVYP